MKHNEQQPWTLDTLLVHGSRKHAISQHSGRPTVQPISPSTTYLHQDAETLDRAFAGELPSGEKAYVYARQGNPNAQALENVLAEAEGGAGAVVFGSGMAAIHRARPLRANHRDAALALPAFWHRGLATRSMQP